MVATGWGAAAGYAAYPSSLLPPPPSSPPLPSIPLRRRSSLSSASSSSSSSSSSQVGPHPHPHPHPHPLSTTHRRFFPFKLPPPPPPPPTTPPFLSVSSPSRSPHLLCRAAEYKFPDPIPEFADAETDKFRSHMLARLTEKSKYFGDFVEEIVDICTEILSNFLHTEYGGPGTLLVIPFIDMADSIREKGLPGAPQAARAAVAWAERHVDKDWKEWTGDRD